jgi:hypothetical protein
MKKLMMAVAAFGMLLTSCQNDLDFVQNVGETSCLFYLFKAFGRWFLS